MTLFMNVMTSKVLKCWVEVMTVHCVNVSLWKMQSDGIQGYCLDLDG